MGWYGFNGGSTLGFSGSNIILAGKVMMNTTISAIIGGIVSFGLSIYMNRNTNHIYDISSLCNGLLAGLVSITAGCGNVSDVGSLFIGLGGGIVYVLFSELLKKLRIDDPIDAFPVHGACGAWGTIAVGFFDETKGIFYAKQELQSAAI